ncbi:MAG TPA: GntR family transcriptional regulator [Bryobacteraceae bacterium]|nr:GntR family transcriptional regulator [Bryobacteraceae bacterium]
MKRLKIPSNLTSLAYKSIKEYILEGRLDEDSRLTEEFLSGQLGISKSPIREALNRLEAEGLIRIEARRGAYLRSFSVKEVADLYDLREALELHAVRTGQLSPELLKELHRSVKRQREYLKSNEKSKYIDEDMSFHAALAGTTGNTALCDVLENLQNQIWLFRRKTYDISSSTASDYHEMIVEALESEDRIRAERIMSEHISEVRKKLVDFLVRQEHDAAATKRPLPMTPVDGRQATRPLQRV